MVSVLDSVWEHLIVALDVPSWDQALELLRLLPQVRWWKVGLELYLGAGSEIVAVVRGQGKRIFLDLKLHDIPNTVAAATGILARQGVDLLTVHASGGLAMLRAAQQATQGTTCRLLGVTLLTSLTAPDLQNHLHVPLDPLDYVQHLAQTCQTAGIPGVVCSPWEAARVRQSCGPDLLIVTPGIRLQPGGDDQARTCTPAQARQQGADWIVVGRPITRAPDPQAALLAYARNWLGDPCC
ncbi:MAG: orotidine-5'-phosphate decarboxylase [Thermostichales cyanobacterium SZTDM-1c_bins_54]